MEFNVRRHAVLPAIGSLLMLLPIYGQLWTIPARDRPRRQWRRGWMGNWFRGGGGMGAAAAERA